MDLENNNVKNKERFKGLKFLVGELGTSWEARTSDWDWCKKRF